MQFWLYLKSYPDMSRDQYLASYSHMIAFGGEFGQGGYAPGWITEWLDHRMNEGRIIQENERLRFTDAFALDLVKQLREF